MLPLTDDGGITWALVSRPSFAGPVYGAVYVPDAPLPTLVAVGPAGISFTADNGVTWTALSSDNHWSVGFSSPGSGWAIGTEGRITKLSLFE